MRAARACCTKENFIYTLDPEVSRVLLTRLYAAQHLSFQTNESPVTLRTVLSRFSRQKKKDASADLSTGKTTPKEEVFALVAGSGTLPQILAQALWARKTPFVVLVYAQTSRALLKTLQDNQTPSLEVGLGQVGRALRFLKVHNATKLVMAGAFKRPSFKELKVDLKGSVWLAGLLKQDQGDDSLLRFISKKIKAEGLEIISPQDLLAPLSAPAGLLTKSAPIEADHKAIEKGFEALAALSPFDVGQSLVMLDQAIVGIEGREGTDQLIQRCALFQKPGQRLILLKAPKATQDLALDPPVVGPQTIALLLKHAFAGVAIEAHQTLLLDQDTLVERLDAQERFLLSLEKAQLTRKGQKQKT